jgi:hypothetical protein
MIFRFILLFFITNLSYSNELNPVCSKSAFNTLSDKADQIMLLEQISYLNSSPCNIKINPPSSKEELCKFSAKDFQALLCQDESMMGFANEGGLFGLETGICWWHSQFHRLATYQAFYNPQKKKIDPSTKEGKKKIKEIFKKIIRKKGPVEIPGYSGLKEFSSDPQIKKLLKNRLQSWMAEDSLLKMQWYKGLVIPHNYSKKAADTYNKGRSRFLYPPMGEKYKNDLIAIEKEKIEQVEFESEAQKQAALNSRIKEISQKTDDFYNNFISELVKDNIELGKTPEQAKEYALKTAQKAQKQYKRMTYGTYDQLLERKNRTLRHQNQEVNELMEQVHKNSKISYITLQHIGVAAHAQIVFDGKKETDKFGNETFIFKIMDSNYQKDLYSKDYKMKPYSLMKYEDGRWYVDPSGSGEYYRFMNVNIKVGNSGQLKTINKLFKDQCGKNLF